MLFTAALVIGIAARIQFGRGMPLWFDETFTGTIATQPSVPALVRWCLTELTGPFFYGTMWLWVKLAGAGTAAMRLPSLILSIAAPLLLYARGHPDRELRLCWAGVALLWLPIVPFANDARPYALLFFLGCVQAIAFLKLIERPTLWRALGWTSVTSLLILTHYSALAIGGIQGMLYLLVHRRRAVATWPALVPFVPVAVWMYYHIGFILGMTGGGGVAAGWSITDLAAIPAILFGSELIGIVILVTVAASLLIPAMRTRLAWATDRRATLLAASGVIACLCALGGALLHAGFAPRYLMASMPALLFGLAWWLRTAARVDARAAVLVGGVMLASSTAILWSASTDRSVDARHHFAFEAASDWLMQRPTDRLVFLWTDAIGEASLERNVADVAGFVFRRAGHPVAVQVVHRRPSLDTNLLARAAAGNDDRTAILWVANDRDTAQPTLPRIAEQDPAWTCRDFGGGFVTIYACRRTAVAPRS